MAGSVSTPPGKAAGPLLNEGADPAALGHALRLTAYEVVLDVLSTINEGYDPDTPVDAPGWCLIETDSQSQRLTGRHVDGLHETILGLDPSGAEGSDLFT